MLVLLTPGAPPLLELDDPQPATAKVSAAKAIADVRDLIRRKSILSSAVVRDLHQVRTREVHSRCRRTPSTRNPPWIPLGHTSIAPINTRPYTASGRLEDTLVESENECARSFVQLGSRTSNAAPQTAPAIEPSPPITTPVSN